MENKIFIKNLWRWKVGLPDLPISKPIPSLEHVYSTNWSNQFEQYMRNRLAMGYFRYGPLNEQKKGEYDCIGSIETRLAIYKESGNDELLVDVANLCLVEFVNGNHPKKHFSSEDDGEHVELIT